MRLKWWKQNRLKAAQSLLDSNIISPEQKSFSQMTSRATIARNFFVNSKDNTPWTPRKYQIPSLESTALRKVHCDGRDVGKTTEIEILAAWAMLNCPNSQMLIAAQTANHLRPVMDRIVRRFETTPAFRNSLIEIHRTPSWRLRFSNGFILWGRIPGPRGINFQGMHVDHQLVDEAQEMTEAAWSELYQALNAYGARWLYGVPNGLRNTFYRMTQDPEAEQHRWPSNLNPDFDDAKDAELARLYGGRTAPGYLHRVLGEHGMPAHGVFNLDDYLECVDSAIDFVNFEVNADDIGPRFSAPCNIPAGEYHLGCDLGYARDPSEFVIYRNAEPHFVNVARAKLTGVNYARQIDVIRELDRAYQFAAIVIDAGNNGRAVAHQLMDLDDEWCARVHCIDFGATIELDPLPDGTTPRRNQKEFMTELLIRRMAERTIVFPPLDERETQYANHTYSLAVNGRIVYDKHNDHLIDADRCAMIARHLHDRSRSTVALRTRIAFFGSR